MEIYFEESFEKDLRSIDNKKQLNKVKEIIQERYIQIFSIVTYE